MLVDYNAFNEKIMFIDCSTQWQCNLVYLIIHWLLKMLACAHLALVSKGLLNIETSEYIHNIDIHLKTTNWMMKGLWFYKFDMGKLACSYYV